MAILKDIIDLGDVPEILVDEKGGFADIWECRPDAFNKKFQEKALNLYEVDGSRFLDNLTGWESLAICTDDVPVVHEEYIDNLYERLLDYEKNGLCDLHHYSKDEKYLNELDYVADCIAEKGEKPILVIENGVLLRLDGYDWYSEIIIPDGVESIGCRTFHERNINRVVIPSSVKTIEAEAFSECSVSEVIIPDSVTFLGEWAFGDCENLKEITIPDGVKNIERWAIGFFHDCSYMEQPYNHEIVIYGKAGSEAENYVKTYGGHSNQDLKFREIC